MPTIQIIFRIYTPVIESPLFLSIILRGSLAKAFTPPIAFSVTEALGELILEKSQQKSIDALSDNISYDKMLK
jgi:hypothetical protein